MSESAPAAPVSFYDHPSSQPVVAAPPVTASAIPPAEPVAQAPGASQPPIEEKQLAPLYDHGEAAEAVAAIEATFNVPDEVKALRAADFTDPALRMTALTVDDIKDPEGAEPMTAETRQAVVNEWRRIAGDAGLSSAELGEVVSLAKQITASPPDEATEAAWNAQNVEQLISAAGDASQAQRDLDLARALVARDPRLFAWLEKTKMGSHPQVVRLVLEKARSQAVAGRLTHPHSKGPQQ
jgi:hypothetical protein